jgi:hypothetical protein
VYSVIVPWLPTPVHPANARELRIHSRAGERRVRVSDPRIKEGVCRAPGESDRTAYPRNASSTSSVRSMSPSVWSALIWVRISSSPFGTTG